MSMMNICHLYLLESDRQDPWLMQVNAALIYTVLGLALCLLDKKGAQILL